MEMSLKESIWQQFGAAIDMLENAVRACPEKLWEDRTRQPEFWYLVYHTLFWLDFYLSSSAAGFVPPAPFTLAELDPAGILPERVYSKDELLAYLERGRAKCRATIATLTDGKARKRWTYGSVDLSFGEVLLDNMRHVQHHAAQLNLILRQAGVPAPGWVISAQSRD